MLLYVVDSKGSSPGRAGFIMAVASNGTTHGSIGGGIMEHKFVEMSKRKLVAENFECTLHHQVHNKSVTKNQSGMICSGEQTNVIYSLKQNDLAAINLLVSIICNKKNGVFEMSPEGINVSNEIQLAAYGLIKETDKVWNYREKIGVVNHLIIIGGGHCALALSRQMKLLDFTVVLYEDRITLPTLTSNHFADEKIIIDQYADLADLIQPIDDTYVVVMTVGYRTDEIAIRALRHKLFKYFGVLGSSKKIYTMLSSLRAAQLPEEWIASLHAPAGVAINSRTPNEIAISIAAEIIKVKNRK